MTITEATDILKLIESKLTTGVPHIILLLQRQLVLYREIKLEDGKYVTGLIRSYDNLKKLITKMKLLITEGEKYRFTRIILLRGGVAAVGNAKGERREAVSARSTGRPSRNNIIGTKN